MQNDLNPSKTLLATMQKLAVQTRIIALLFVVIVLIIVAQTFGLSWLRPAAADDGGTKKVQAIPEDFQAAPYPDTEEGKQAAYGEKLILSLIHI